MTEPTQQRVVYSRYLISGTAALSIRHLKQIAYNKMMRPHWRWQYRKCLPVGEQGVLEGVCPPGSFLPLRVLSLGLD